MKRVNPQCKGQMFTIDFILGMVGFIFLLLIAVKVLLGLIPSSEYEDLYRDNLYISDQLVDAGYPQNWNNTTVIVPGLMSASQLNITKLTQFDSLEYNRTKIIFHVNNEYLFFFKNSTDILNITTCLHGYPLLYNTTTCEPDLTTITYDNLVHTTRLIAHNNTLLQLVIYSWN
ncbi:hypothetical protein K9M74_04410 [Candidatus Woesearchaeota archaeon]|nr:hypothetical protein [Candidatus Woesearchaeota archaeon]